MQQPQVAGSYRNIVGVILCECCRQILFKVAQGFPKVPLVAIEHAQLIAEEQRFAAILGHFCPRQGLLQVALRRPILLAPEGRDPGDTQTHGNIPVQRLPLHELEGGFAQRLPVGKVARYIGHRGQPMVAADQQFGLLQRFGQCQRLGCRGRGCFVLGQADSVDIARLHQ